MVVCLQFVALGAPGMVRMGPLRLSVYGIFAAAALIAALLLSQRAAQLAGLSADSLWDAGLFTLGAAFVLSRLLLVVQSPAAFLHYPLLVLTLPSLTYTGMALTAVATLIYLRRKRLPLLTVMDAWAPCAALLAAVLALGHFVEGTDAGMPTALPWGVVTAGDTILGRVHPVQIYAAIAATTLLAVTWRSLARGARTGVASGVALCVGGMCAFLLDMLAQPTEARGDAWLEPGQYAALLAVWLGTAVMGTRTTAGIFAERDKQQVLRYAQDDKEICRAEAEG